MMFKRIFFGAALACLGFSAVATAQTGGFTVEGGSASSQPPCEDACCFKQSKGDDGRVKFECVSNWCQQTCQLVYPKGADGKEDFNKKPSCGCNAAPPPSQPPPGSPPPPADDGGCRDKAGTCQKGKECIGKMSKTKGKCDFNLLRGGCYCDTGPLIKNPLSSVQSDASTASSTANSVRSIGGLFGR